MPTIYFGIDDAKRVRGNMTRVIRVYALDKTRASSFAVPRMVLLPGNKVAEVQFRKGYYPVARISDKPVPRDHSNLPKARLVYDYKDPAPRVNQQDEWTPSLLEKMTAAGETNNLFVVLLSNEEYQRLCKVGLQEFHGKLTKLTIKKLQLQAESCINIDDGPSLDIYRHCSCCH